MIHFRFYGDLNDFPLPRRRGREFARAGAAGASAKDAIEACGVPHVEVDLILVDGEPRDFGTILRDGDRVSVYPAFALAGPETGLRLLPPLPRPARFVLDNHLGRLASRLRLLGFDTLYRNDLVSLRVIQFDYIRQTDVIEGNILRFGFGVVFHAR